MTQLMDKGPEKERDSRTKLMGPAGGHGTQLHTPQVAKDQPAAPVVGWLVIIAGAGQGKSLELSYGMTVIGRGAQNRLQIDFGDDGISQDDHFRIAYDGENREFHLIPGRGTNLLYLAGKPLLQSQLLAGQVEFRVGSTTLRFVPLCSPAWDWSMVETKPATG